MITNSLNIKYFKGPFSTKFNKYLDFIYKICICKKNLGPLIIKIRRDTDVNSGGRSLCPPILTDTDPYISRPYMHIVHLFIAYIALPTRFCF